MKVIVTKKVTIDDTQALLEKSKEPMIIFKDVVDSINLDYNTLDDLFADKYMLPLILKNGIYKAVVCLRFNIDCMTINVDGVEHTFLTPSPITDSDTLIYGNSNYTPYGIIVE